MSHTIRRFRPADADAMLGFAQALPEHDLLFLGRDLRHLLTPIDNSDIRPPAA